MVSFTQAVKSGFKNYAEIKGRACRSEFWWWVLFVVIAGVAAALVDVSAFGRDAEEFGLAYLLTMLVLFCPNVAVVVRRMHDGAHSGWWLVIAPLCGILLSFVIVVAVEMSGLPNDTGDRWMLLISVVLFFLAWLVLAAGLLLFWLVQPGTRGDNRYGPDPLGRGDAAFQAADGDAPQ